MAHRKIFTHSNTHTPDHDTRTIINTCRQSTARQPLKTFKFIENHPSHRRGNVQRNFAYKREISNDRENQENHRKKFEQEPVRPIPVKLYDIKNSSYHEKKNRLNELLGPYVPMDAYNEIMKIFDAEGKEKEEMTELLQKEKLKKEEKEQTICKLKYRTAILERQLTDKAEISYKKCTERLIKCAAGFMETTKRISYEEILKNKLVDEDTFYDMVKCGEKSFDLGSDRRALVEDLTGYAKGDPKCSFRLFNDTCEKVFVADTDRYGNEFRVEGKRVFKETRI